MPVGFPEAGPREPAPSSVASAIDAMRSAVVEHKAHGVGLPQNMLRPSEDAFLRRALSRLRRRLKNGIFDPVLADHVDKVRRLTGGRDPRSFGRRSGLYRLLASSEHGRSASYFMAQVRSMDLTFWAKPVEALFVAACHLAVHDAYRREFDKTEPDYTRALLASFPDTVKQYVVGPLLEPGAEIPEGLFLHFGVASMEADSDLQGADLALVVGTRLFGKPIWRVVLVQAKREVSQGRADVGYKDGTQFDEIFSTGMGAYLFYPIVKHGRAFIPTVRRAEDVFREVWGSEAAPVYDRVDPCGPEGSAWDLATFVALKMTEPTNPGVGRIFASADAVADALSLGRERPLEPASVIARHRPKHLFIASTIPELDVLEFRPKIEKTFDVFEFFGIGEAPSVAPTP